MSAPVLHTWKRAPFIRMLIPLMTGIILQWHLKINPELFWILLIVSVLLSVPFFFIPFAERYRLSLVNGLAIAGMFIALGGLLSWYKNIQHDRNWFGSEYRKGNTVIVTLLENPVEKTRSFKANASVDYVFHQDTAVKTTGTLILYLKKDSSLAKLGYGSQIMINKPLQEIKNSGNPGGFDYKRYSLFQGITHQVFLKGDDFELLPGKNRNRITQFIFSTREKVLNILRTNINGEKELGLAEALLIGYKDDLDKSLVQSYSNTGVVHIIAISGLHLGLIYWLLLMLLKPLMKRKGIKWLKPVLMITGLWLFSLLAGAQPSVIRSAVMFTCIILGELAKRKTSIYNTLAFSAMLLLVYNPFWLWDVGFQLSYAAVLSIAIFMQPVYNWFYIKNRILDFTWKLNAVTIAAQILTVPLSIYHFHQFPVYFLLTNFLAVPLSSIILLGEILLCAISFIPFAAAIIGKILSWLIWIMNSYIEQIEATPFSLWDGLQISIPQAVLLFVTAAGLGFWLIEKNKAGFKYGLISLACFFIMRTSSFLDAKTQQRVIVYNVPQKLAMDLIDGRKYWFVGDSDLLEDDFVRNFHIKPSRVLQRIDPAVNPENIYRQGNFINFYGKKILLLDKTVRFNHVKDKIQVDLLILSGNPKLYFNKLAETFTIKQAVFDSRCPAWKVNYWKRDCDSLQIRYHDVSEKGAFVMNLR